MRVVILGSGTSHGVPVIGCECSVCRSADPRDQRTRSSVWIQVGRRNVLIDVGPDLRMQALTYGLTNLDAILFTHCHADHVFGLDDVRAFNHRTGREIPCYGRRDVLQELANIFRYAFRDTQEGGGKPRVSLRPVEGPFCLSGISVVPIPLLHGEVSIYGYRLGPFAYLTDCSSIPGRSMALLEGLEVLVIGAPRYSPHPTHLCVGEALGVIEQLQPGRAYLTHLSHDMRHSTAEARLEPGVYLAYDGLTFCF